MTNFSVGAIQREMAETARWRAAATARQAEEIASPPAPGASAGAAITAMPVVAGPGPAEVRKSFADRGATEGPGHLKMPHEVAPDNFQRGYLREGRAGESPMSGPATQFPHLQPGEADDSPGIAGLAMLSPDVGDGHREAPASAAVPHDGSFMTPAEQAHFPLVAGHDGPVFTALNAHYPRVTMRPPVPGGDTR